MYLVRFSKNKMNYLNSIISDKNEYGYMIYSLGIQLVHSPQSRTLFMFTADCQ